MVRSIFGGCRYLNEAKESDFEGKDTIVVVRAVGSRMVQKKPGEMRRRDDDGFAEKSRNYGVEAYYLVDAATAGRLMSTCLFYSTVDPEDGQLLYMLKGMEPVAVHRSAGTNFAYRASNEFETICCGLRQVMQAVFGAGDVKVYSFRTGWNSGYAQSYRSANGLASRWYGVWESVQLGDDDAAVAKFQEVKAGPRQSFRQYGPQLAAAARGGVADRSADFDGFLGMKPKKFTVSESDRAGLRAQAMMDDLAEAEGWNPDDEAADFSDAQAREYEEQQANEFDCAFLDACEDASRQCGLTLRRSRGGVAGPGTWDYRTDPSDWTATVTHEFRMFDPLDSDFYRAHSPFLEKVQELMSRSGKWRFEYVNFDGAPDSKMIGTKFVRSSSRERESGAAGVEETFTYDVVEQLRVALDTSAEPGPGDGLALESEPGPGDGAAEVDFPAWALDYWVNGELGSVSRQERDQIEAWRQTMELNGYDTGMIDFGEDEDFSSSPEFGLPCDCVEATVCSKRQG